jgi:hypothetical protein
MGIVEAPASNRPNFKAMATLCLKVQVHANLFIRTKRGEGDGSRLQAHRFTPAGNRCHAKASGHRSSGAAKQHASTGEVHPVRGPFLSANQNHTPAALSPLRRQNPREEPGAFAAHAGSVRAAAGNGGRYRDHRAPQARSRQSDDAGLANSALLQRRHYG